MTKFICSICGYTHEGNEAPGRCPVCKSPSTQFMLMEDPDQEGVKDVENAAKEKEHSCNGETCSTEQEQVKEQEDSVDTVEKDNKDEGVKLSNISDNALCSEEDELEILKNGTAILQAVKWYKDKHNCSLKEAKDVVDYVYEKHGLRSSTNKGCVITILIAITSTLSVFCFL